MVMTTDIYVDTNIWMDFLLGRDDRAQRFFLKTFACTYTVVINEQVLRELRKHNVPFETIMGLLNNRQKLSVRYLEDADIALAHTLPTHHADGLHAATAIRFANGNIITKNVRDFEHLLGITILDIETI